jgi:hypothetical protein
MGKRGPKASGGYGDKTGVLSTRITAELRAALQQSAGEHGRTLSSEIEHRLRRSFDSDNLVENLGGQQLYAMLRTISAVMMMAGTKFVSSATEKRHQNVDWLSDPEAYDQAVKATIRVLEELRPAPPPKRKIPRVPKGKGALAEVVHTLEHHRGEAMANLLLADIGEAEPTQPLPGGKLSPAQRLVRRIASDLGPAHKRLQPKE